MNNMKLAALIALLIFAPDTAAAEPAYHNDFEKAEVGGVPEEFLVLDGNFEVKEEGGNKFLELPGAPLDAFGVLFGPAAREDVTVTAKILGTGKGRRFPTFDVGLNGVGGYRLRVSPGKKQLEIIRNDTVKAAVPLEWESGKWTFLKLAVLKEEGKWAIAGKYWQEGAEEPAAPVITFADSEAPPAGRASIHASPYSGLPIRFDELRVAPAK
jgi:hypothetical protein